MHKSDKQNTSSLKLSPKTKFTQNAHYDRFIICSGLEAWIYQYTYTKGARVGALTSSIQIATQLQGGWLQRGDRSGTRLYQPGMTHTLSSGERYDLAFSAGTESGIVVGFHFYPYEFFANKDSDRVLQINPAKTYDPKLLDACWQLYKARSQGLAPPSFVRSAVLDFLYSAADFSSCDPLWCAKKEIDCSYSHDLYLKHLAEIASMHPRTFLRHFTQRFGVTPVQYRIKQRLNAIARASWKDPSRSISALAAGVGFSNRSYLHRAFRHYFGTTPNIYRRIK